MPDLAIGLRKQTGTNGVPWIGIFSWGVKTVLAVASVGFVYREIFYNKDLEAIIFFVSGVFKSRTDFVILTAVMLLMVVNWALESVKWRFLIRKIENISGSTALKAIFSGITVSVFTPNRIGDFGARVLYLHYHNRIKGVFITMVGSMGQLAVTVLFGICAVGYYFLSMYPGTFETAPKSLLLGILALSGLLTAVGYYNLAAVSAWGKSLLTILQRYGKHQMQKRLGSYVDVFSLYSFRELSTSLVYSLARYGVFTVQYYLLLTLFKVQLTLPEAAALISLTFFSMAVIPTVALTEIGVRSSVALFFLGLASPNGIGIVTATFALWVVNLALPALIGSILIFSVNIFYSNTRP